MSVLLQVKGNTGERVREGGNVTPCLKPVSTDIATPELCVHLPHASHHS